MEMGMAKAIRVSLLLIVVSVSVTAIARADEVTDWNQIMLDALIAGNVGGIVATRHAAIVSPQSMTPSTASSRVTYRYMSHLQRHRVRRRVRRQFRQPMPLC
jgi:hypothetical protein